MSIFNYNNNIFSYKNKVFKTSWKPNMINDMIFWSDANSRNIKHTNGLIEIWKDNSGNLNNATQNIENRKPSILKNIINGYPVLYFQNYNSLKIPLHINYYTTVTVIKSFNNNYIYEFGNTDTQTGFYLNGSINTIKTTTYDTTTLSSIKNNTINWLSGSWKIIIHQYNGTHNGHKLIINGINIPLSNINSGNPGDLNKTDYMILGTNYNNTYGLNAYVSEFMIFNDYLDINNISLINNWLINKYNIY